MIPGLLGTLSGGFRYTDIAGCKLWLYPITGLVNNNPVDLWPDLSGNNNSPAQATGSKQPVFKASGIGGKPSVEFSYSSSTELVKTGFNLVQPYTIFVVATVSEAREINGVIGGTASGSDAVFFTTSTATTFYAGGSILDLSETAPFSGEVFSIVADSTSSWYRNGVFKKSGNAGTNGIADLSIGAIWEQYYLGGQIGAVVIYDTALSTLNRQLVEYELGSYFSLTLDQRPVNTVAPAITAAEWAVGITATCDTGTWTNSPTSYAYQWQLVDGGVPQNIVGATSNTLVIPLEVATFYLRCTVTPSNAFATGTGIASNEQLIPAP